MKRLIGLLFVVSWASADAQLYHVTDLGALAGNTQSLAWSVNDAGQAVGVSFTGNPNSGQAFFYSGGTMTGLGGVSWAYGINSSGVAVGYAPFGARTDAFSYDGAMHDLGTLGGPGSWATAISDSGQIVGTSYVDSFHSHAFLYSGGTMHDIGILPGGTSAAAYAISSNGLIAGSSDGTGHGEDPFLYSGGVMSDLGLLPGADFGYAYGVNASGIVVGVDSVQGVQHGFIYNGSTTTDLGGGAANSINDAGTVVGVGSGGGMIYSNGVMQNLNNLVDASGAGISISQADFISANGTIAAAGYVGGRDHALILTPVPEPMCIIGLGMGVASLILRRRARRA